MGRFYNTDPHPPFTIVISRSGRWMWQWTVSWEGQGPGRGNDGRAFSRARAEFKAKRRIQTMMQYEWVQHERNLQRVVLTVEDPRELL